MGLLVFGFVFDFCVVGLFCCFIWCLRKWFGVFCRVGVFGFVRDCGCGCARVASFGICCLSFLVGLFCLLDFRFRVWWVLLFDVWVCWL